ncbi:MAG: hypothetical protein ALECFALPRED_009644 [Alectoria fallacina]|uniref:AAA+ ATPase domain-containing protein n=1 Tax=Alectoria fallacina TaxID=1903189 RepID=A0A8H3PJD0_9LECA|nr:MAG: hypothetical protein ALECFALPRED_009644 [Alectoria fallacina]
MAEDLSGQAPRPPFVNAAQASSRRHRRSRNRQARTSATASSSFERQMASLAAKPQVTSSPSVLPFFLPKIVPQQFEKCCYSKSSDAYLDHAKENHEFSVFNLAWAIQNGVGEKCIERYLTQHNESEIAERLCQSMQTAPGAPFFPILYFAAERNSPEIVRILCHAGAKPSQSIGLYGEAIFGLPLLPYTILRAEHQLSDTTETVVALLAMGASPHDVPKDMWQDYLRAPTKDKPKHVGVFDIHETWCTAEIREALCKTFNLLQRYSLWKAAQIERPTVREIQVAKAHNIMPLFEVPYYIFGQQLATTQVLQRITSRLLFNSLKPLILLFTGLSGHGKTELARRMGGLLSLELIVVDCTMMRHDTDIFGPWSPYYGSQVGSQLNNHLVEWDGKRTVVFLDEFDKTTDDVRQAMLLLFESGSYTDRRNNNKIDCSKVLWILAANLGATEITKFWMDNLKDRSQKQQKLAPIRDLQVTLKQCIIQKFGAPLTGRFSAIVPFLPFSEGERAITAYKFMRELWHDVRKPIDTEGKRFAGTIFVNFVNDGQIAKHIADRYLEETGARSLADAVEEEISDKLAAEFFKQEGEVRDEMNTLPLPNYNVRVVSGSGKNNHIKVTSMGVSSLQTAPA